MIPVEDYCEARVASHCSQGTKAILTVTNSTPRDWCESNSYWESSYFLIKNITDSISKCRRDDGVCTRQELDKEKEKAGKAKSLCRTKLLVAAR